MRWFWFSFLCALAPAGCLQSERLLEGAPCPCSSDYVCCQATQTCVLKNPGCAFGLELVVPAEGPVSGGIEVLLIGEGFEPGMRVLFNGAECEYEQPTSDRLLSCTLPPGAPGKVSIELIRPGAEPEVFPNEFSYARFGLISVSPNEGPAVGGQRVTIEGFGLSEDMRILLGDSDCSDAEFNPPAQVTCTTGQSRVGLASVFAITPDDDIALLEQAYTFVEDLRITAVQPSTGPAAGGTAVSILGVDFSDQTQILIGATPCLRQVFVDNTRIDCVAPPAAIGVTTIDVVANKGGSRAALSGGFRYILDIFTDYTSVSGYSVSNYGTGLIAFDQDGDALPELLLVRRAPDTGLDGPIFYRNAGGLFFVDQSLEQGFGMPPLNLLGAGGAADYNNDGNIDVLIAGNNGQSNANLLLGGEDALLTLGPRPLLLENSLITGASALDLDGDSRIDWIGCRNVAVQGTLPEKPLAFLRNTEAEFVEDPSVFGVSAQNPSQRCSGAMAVGDVDLDGDPDLVVCSERLTFLINESGTFVDRTAELNLPTTATVSQGAHGHEICRSLHLIDVDADGDLDLSMMHNGDPFVATLAARKTGVRIFLNLLDEGALGFEPLPSSDPDTFADQIVGLCPVQSSYLVDGPSLRAGVRHSVWGDYDLDGDLDVFIPIPSSMCPRPAWVMENQVAQLGRVEFRLKPLAPTATLGSMTSAGMVDLDGDGDVDFVSRMWGVYGGQAIFRNNHIENGGGGRFIKVRAISDANGDATESNDGQPDRLEPSLTFQVDLDAETPPDFQLGGATLARTGGTSGSAFSTDGEVHFGLGDRTEPVWVRTWFPDGSEVRRLVTNFDQTVELFDCAEALCIQ